VAHDNRKPTTQPCAATHAIALPTARFNHSTWRRVLATGVASAALFAYSGRPVRAQTVPPAPPCNTISGTTGSIVTCTGDVSTGVNLPNAAGPFQVLNINNLTADIAPASGVTGISFTSNGPVEVNVNPGPFTIRTTDADGIFAATNAGTVTVNSTADIITTGGGAVGILASGQNDLLTITSSGGISTSGNNAFGIAAGTVYGDVNVTSTGNITTTGTFAAGINVGTIGTAGTMQGAITIFSSGDIETSGNSSIGINAATVYGPIDVTSLSDITVLGTASIGINAQSQGDIRIASLGDIATGPTARWRSGRCPSRAMLPSSLPATSRPRVTAPSVSMPRLAPLRWSSRTAPS
jgi:hypothetical protein